MATKKRKRAKKRAMNPKVRTAKPSGWIRAAAVRFVRKGGKLVVQVRKPRRKKR